MSMSRNVKVGISYYLLSANQIKPHFYHNCLDANLGDNSMHMCRFIA